MIKALFLDRDGTINIDKSYVYKIEDFFFCEGIFDLCRTAEKKGYKIIVVTNQSGIARSYYTEEDFQKLNSFMIEKFREKNIAILDVFHCPFLEGNDRKPNPGLFLTAAKKYNIDMENSVSAGDKETDIMAALNAGVKNNFLISKNREIETKATKVVGDLSELNKILQLLE